MRHALAVILLFVVGSAQASTVTIDFEDVPYGSQDLVISSNGFDFVYQGPAAGLGSVPYTGVEPIDGNNYSICLQCGNLGFTFSEQSSQRFSLESLEFHYSVGGLSGIDGGVFITGVLSSGATVSMGIPERGSLFCLIYPEECPSEIVGPEDRYLMTFGSEWVDLVDVTVTVGGGGGGSKGIAFDNITVNVVPIPAAVWLFGSGLGLLGWFRRRQTA